MEDPGHPNYYLDQDGFIYKHTKKFPLKIYLACQKKQSSVAKVQQ